jgi:hypothetical protein
MFHDVLLLLKRQKLIGRQIEIKNVYVIIGFVNNKLIEEINSAMP